MVEELQEQELDERELLATHLRKVHQIVEQDGLVLQPIEQEQESVIA